MDSGFVGGASKAATTGKHFPTAIIPACRSYASRMVTETLPGGGPVSKPRLVAALCRPDPSSSGEYERRFRRSQTAATAKLAHYRVDPLHTAFQNKEKQNKKHSKQNNKETEM
jgi:hypothetical protein